MNVLLIVIDDVGKEVIGGTGPGGTDLGGAGTYILPSTPNIDAMIAAGCLFANFRVAQLCSPTRAACLTGRHPERTGVMDIIRDTSPSVSTQPDLQLSEQTLAKCFKSQGYETGIFGKYHLAKSDGEQNRHPALMGFDAACVNMYNLANSGRHTVEGVEYREGYYASPMIFGAGLDSYGEERTLCTFHTSHVVTMAKRWINSRRGDWFCYVPFFGAHAPFINNSTTVSAPFAINAPPTSLYDSATWTHAQDATDPDSNPAQVVHAFRAHIEALDTEIGRLLQGIDYADTLVCLFCDNGSSSTTLALEEHPTLGLYTGSHGKDSPYEPGITSPLVLRGPGVSAGIRYEKLASVVDVFPTLLTLAGCDLPTGVTLDGVSLADQCAGSTAVARTFSFSEWGQPNGIGVTRTALEWALVGDADGSGTGRYKLIKPMLSGTYEMYDLGSGVTYNPMESSNLTPSGSTSGLNAGQLAAYTALVAEYARLQASFLEEQEA